MSATSYFFVDILASRSRRSEVTYGLPAGVKKSVKKRVSRAVRQESQGALRREVTALQQETTDANDSVGYLFEDIFHFDAMDYAEKERFTDAWLAAHSEEVEIAADESTEVSLHQIELPVLAGLPDWMLERLENGGGSAFEYLSLLEEKRPRNSRATLVEEFEYE